MASLIKNRQVNPWIKKQKGYAVIDKQISDDAIRSAITQMIETDTIPKRNGGLQNRVTKPRVTETDRAKVEIWNDMQDAEGYFFKARTINKETGETNEYLAHTEKELVVLVMSEYGKFLGEQDEIEAANNPEIPEDQEAAECGWWVRNTVHGAEYNSIACQRTWELMRAAIGNRPVDRTTLEMAYCQVADSSDYDKNFERYFAKRDRLIRESESQTAEGRRLAEQEASDLARQQQEEKKFSREQKIRFDEADIAYNKDLAKTPQSMKMLREKMMMEKKAGRTPTLPSSGTGQRRNDNE